MTLPADPVTPIDEFVAALGALHRPDAATDLDEAVALVNAVHAMTEAEARRALLALVNSCGWEVVRDAIDAIREQHERGAAG